MWGKMKEPKIPDWWADDRSEESDDKGKFSEFRDTAPKRKARRQSSQSAMTSGEDHLGRESSSIAALTVPRPQEQEPSIPDFSHDEIAITRPPRLPLWKRLKLPGLQTWLILCVLGFGGAGFAATAMLLKMPSLPNCPSIFWPLASASVRLYCAQVAAEKQTVDDLLEAIELVNTLPADHPLRTSINDQIEDWTQKILDLAEDTFQEGKLTEAIRIARKVPLSKGSGVANAQSIEERIDRWESIWGTAEEVYKNAEAFMRKQYWGQAFREATKLLSLGNHYWETTKYKEITTLLQSAREDGGKLGRADELASAGGADNLVEAIKLAEKIGSKSYVYQEARKAIKEYGKKMMSLAEAALAAKDLNGAIAIARRIPDSTGLKEESRDFITLARAESQAWSLTVGNLENAIQAAQRIEPDSPLYRRAQQLIDRWQSGIDQVAVLEQARDSARTGSVNDLTAAIAQAQLIPQSNPLWEEAQGEIQQWRAQIETDQDRPYLTQARELASRGDVNSLQAAIAQAGRIGSGRALSGEAQDLISQWQGEISRRRDQPYLSEARAQANAGNIDRAISSARQIPANSSLYGEAQSEITSWQTESDARSSLDGAYSKANSGTPDALFSAIAQANQIPGSSSWRGEADRAIRQWSQDLINIAQDRSWADLSGAIAVADKVPAYSGLYGQAQALVEDWQKLLNSPAPAVSEPPPAAAEPYIPETEPYVPEPEPYVPEPEPEPYDPPESSDTSETSAKVPLKEPLGTSAVSPP